MTRPQPLKPSDLRGYTRLVADATVQMTGLVEHMHRNIARGLLAFGDHQSQDRTRGITGLVYESVRTIAGLVGTGTAQVLEQLERLFPESAEGSPAREHFVAALNGVLGDHLEASGNPLALPMRLRRDESVPASGKVLVLIHGLCMNPLQWYRGGHHHGAALARDLGYTPVHVHYNSGRHISTNGRELADALEVLLADWPVPVQDFAIVGHSLGGLVARSACHYAEGSGLAWRAKLKRIVFLGTPHHGAPLERGGNWLHNFAGITPYTAPLARLGMIRSAGVTDLRHGNLLDEDWQGRGRFERGPDPRRCMPLPAGVTCYAAAATTGRRRGDVPDSWLGDGLVPVDSALGRHPELDRCLGLAEENTWLGFGMNHWDLLGRGEVYERIRSWLI